MLDNPSHKNCTQRKGTHFKTRFFFRRDDGIAPDNLLFCKYLQIISQIIQTYDRIQQTEQNSDNTKKKPSIKNMTCIMKQRHHNVRQSRG